jgi:hypothetical protein
MMDPLTVVQQKIILVILLYARVLGGTLKYYLYTLLKYHLTKHFSSRKDFKLNYILPLHNVRLGLAIKTLLMINMSILS